MYTIEEDGQPNLFDLPPGPSPVQYDLFAEEELQEVEATMDSQAEN